MPKVGLRILKSALAVFLCFVVYLVRQETLHSFLHFQNWYFVWIC